jgi:lipopolysaccharide export LptBFGC system permease protein LptF
MILSIYLIKKFFKALLICGGISFAIFFIFSLVGNLGEKFSFNSILYLSALNSFQIFTFIPSHLYILSFCLIIMNLKSKNELIIIKAYIELKKLLLIIFPILILFVFIELNKDSFSANIEKMKTKLSNSENFENTKIFISTDGNKSKYYIFFEVNSKNETMNQYLEFDVENQKIKRGEISNQLNIQNNNLYSSESIVYENNDFRYEFFNKKLFDNFSSIWSTSSKTIIKNNANNKNLNYEIFQFIIFHFLFYVSISMIFLSKKLVKRNINILKIFLLILIIFLYHLLIPNIKINNFYYFFQVMSLMVFILIFLKTKNYE